MIHFAHSLVCQNSLPFFFSFPSILPTIQARSFFTLREERGEGLNLFHNINVCPMGQLLYYKVDIDSHGGEY